jgi:hypothetical protein
MSECRPVYLSLLSFICLFESCLNVDLSSCLFSPFDQPKLLWNVNLSTSLDYCALKIFFKMVYSITYIN